MLLKGRERKKSWIRIGWVTTWILSKLEIFFFQFCLDFFSIHFLQFLNKIMFWKIFSFRAKLYYDLLFTWKNVMKCSNYIYWGKNCMSDLWPLGCEKYSQNNKNKGHLQNRTKSKDFYNESSTNEFWYFKEDNFHLFFNNLISIHIFCFSHTVMWYRLLAHKEDNFNLCLKKPCCRN